MKSVYTNRSYYKDTDTSDTLYHLSDNWNEWTNFNVRQLQAFLLYIYNNMRHLNIQKMLEFIWNVPYVLKWTLTTKTMHVDDGCLADET